METLSIVPYNEVFIRVNCEAGTAYEMSEYFTFTVPGAKFMPAVRNKVWDGKIRLFNVATKLLYKGLIPYVEQFAKERDYKIDLHEELEAANEFSIAEAKEFCKSLDIDPWPRDYQLQAFVHSIRHNRGLLLSPTASGKSLIIYLITQYLIETKVLIIVPTVSLVYQMKTDFLDYAKKGALDESFIRVISGTESKDWLQGHEEPITITTWQSIHKMPKKWFSQFGTIIGDEAHLFKAKSLTSIMTKLEDCKYRYGFTGTLDGTQTHKLVLEGLFGSVEKVTTTSTLIEQKHLAEFKIKATVLKYPDHIKQQCKQLTYQQEIDFLIKSTQRNRFIRNLAVSLSGNTLLLFQILDHGKELKRLIDEMVEQTIEQRKTFYVAGQTEALERENIRAIVENETNAIICASYGTFSTGVNIKNLHNIIFASPSKSRIRNLQSIGRGLRKSDSKESATLFDIADDLTWKAHKNYTIQHFAERIKIYNEERFDYKIYTVKLKV